MSFIASWKNEQLLSINMIRSYNRPSHFQIFSNLNIFKYPKNSMTFYLQYLIIESIISEKQNLK